MISTRVGPLQLCSQADNDDNWLDQFFISAYEESATALQEVELQHTLIHQQLYNIPLLFSSNFVNNGN